MSGTEPAPAGAARPTAGVLLRELARVIDRRDWDGLRELLDPDAVVEYAYDGERFDREGFVRLNADYPGTWGFEVERLVDGGGSAAMLARVSDGSETHWVSTFATAGGGRLRELVETWVEQGAPPSERRPDLGGARGDQGPAPGPLEGS